MGFSSIDDLVAELSAGKKWRSEFCRSTSGIGTVVAGRWYDLAMFPLNSSQANYLHGNLVSNWDFFSGSGNWTLNGVNWSWVQATHLASRAASADGLTLTQNTAGVNGVTYSVAYVITRSAGSITPSLGGTAGTARSSSSSFRENIVCGATAGAPITFTPDATFVGTVDVVSVTRELGFTPYSDVSTGKDAGLWHGGDVSTDTKHLMSLGANVNVAAGAPSMLMLVDILGCYPRIQTNSAAVQTLNNSLTLPRYTDGKQVRMYYQLSASNGANAQNTAVSYTAPGSVTGRSLGAVVSNTASAIVSHVIHSGVAGGNFGPFLPLQAGDSGVMSVQTVQFSAASASAGFVDLVLCVPLGVIPLTAAFYHNERDFLNQLPSLPRIYDGACLCFLHMSGAVTPTCLYSGAAEFAWG